MKKQILTLIALLAVTVMSAQTKAQWGEYNGVSMPMPPKNVHPRLYIQEYEIPALKAKLKRPEAKKLLAQLEEMKKDWKPEDIPAKKDFRFYFSQKGPTVRAFMDALEYLLNGNKTKGRNAIKVMLHEMQTIDLPHQNHGDLTRAWGLMLTNGAMVYDWCYPLMSESNKKAYIKEFMRIAQNMECGWPPVKQGAVSGHSSEWMIMRDLLSAGIAIYDECPELYHQTAHRFFSEHVKARNFFYPSHNYHQGTSYFNVRFSNDMFATWILDKMGAPGVFSPSQQFVMYDLLYRRRPDNQVVPSGDVNYQRKSPAGYTLPAMLAANYYKDEYLNSIVDYKPNIEDHCKIFQLLWTDYDLGKKSSSDLPLTRFSGTPFGWMISRTGWDANSVIAEMKVNEYHFANHQHLDAGSFYIYYKGPLAIDAGSYKGSSGGYNSAHNKNFFKRTIAHNSLLVFDPEEVFESGSYGGSDRTKFAANDGGQRMPGHQWGEMRTLDTLLHTNYKVGQTLAYDFGPNQLKPEFSYLKGDITEAYSKKVKEVKRSFVFLNLLDEKVPAAMVIFDKVVSSNPDFKKFWLLHSIEEPVINGNEFTVSRTKNGDSGMLHNTVLLPAIEDAAITPVGGEGKEFWVFGTNYKNDNPNDVARESGDWRVEVSPKNPAAENLFLNVIQVADNSQKELHKARMIDGGRVVGVEIANRIVTFAKDGNELDRPF
ncbi:MAG: heparin/heparin-sulfate lyase HepB, partial [Bacteroidales bacterium]